MQMNKSISEKIPEPLFKMYVKVHFSSFFLGSNHKYNDRRILCNELRRLHQPVALEQFRRRPGRPVRFCRAVVSRCQASGNGGNYCGTSSGKSSSSDQDGRIRLNTACCESFVVCDHEELQRTADRSAFVPPSSKRLATQNRNSM